jgi:hypothetical protein
MTTLLEITIIFPTNRQRDFKYMANITDYINNLTGINKKKPVYPTPTGQPISLSSAKSNFTNNFKGDKTLIINENPIIKITISVLSPLC